MGGVAARCERAGIVPVCLIVGGDDRLERFRHPLADGSPMHRQAMAVLVGMRHGLHVALTRHVSAGPPGGALATYARRGAADRDGRARRLLRDRPDVRRRARTAWPRPTATGGGRSTGRAARSATASASSRSRPPRPPRAGTPSRSRPHHAIAFNPSVAGGGKAEDTFLVADGRLVAVTESADWPMVEVGGRPAPQSWRSDGHRPLPVVGLRSARWFAAHDLPGFLHRASVKAIGYSRAALDGRPVIGICNPWSEVVNCNVHFRGLAEAVRRGVLAAGGLPLEFPVSSLGENLQKPTTMLFRNLMAMDVEEAIRSYPFDAVVLIGGCDKTQPAQLMGAASADVPAIMLTGGTVEAGRVPRPRALGRHRPVALHRRAPRGQDHARRVRRARGRVDSRRRPLQRDGHGLDDGRA